MPKNIGKKKKYNNNLCKRRLRRRKEPEAGSMWSGSVRLVAFWMLLLLSEANVEGQGAKVIPCFAKSMLNAIKS